MGGSTDGQILRRTGAGIAVLHDTSILLIRREDHALWDIPGGGSENDESPERTARRELLEETGLSAGRVHALGAVPHRNAYLDGNAVDWETHVFAAAFAGEEPRALDDAAEVRWWLLAALPDNVSDATRAYFTALRAAGS
ncbi:NUDIX domain-containing protein [Deinococcus sp.]|uniref:NUDIX hydrolase n=1 Tax=Deinococcus sp. TaxID=47478 RepID=UPI002869B2C4|nr:NUDIX domain-containing protein [Deinococcus sp.]